MFIRFKNIPPNEISGVYDGDCGRIRDEKGVSCYHCIEEQGAYKIIIPSLCNGVLFDLINFIEDFKRKEFPVFLITGNKVGIGTHGEPVIKDVRIIAELEIVELAEPKPIYKMDRTNPQFKIKQ